MDTTPTPSSRRSSASKRSLPKEEREGAKRRRTRSDTRAQQQARGGSKAPGGTGSRRQSAASHGSGGSSRSKYPRFMHDPIPDSPEPELPETFIDTLEKAFPPEGAAGEQAGQTDPTKSGAAAGTTSGEEADATKKGPEATGESAQKESSVFPGDDEIIRGWNKMERIIARFVDMVLVDRLPLGALNKDKYPYKALDALSEKPKLMCTNPARAKYMFQSSMWNILDKWFFSRTSTAWACEGEDAATNEESKTRGLAAAMSKLTWDFGIHDDGTKSLDERMRFFMWRQSTVDFVLPCALDQAAYERQVQEVVFSILQTYLGYFKPELSTGDAASWDELVYRTGFVVSEAAMLARKMRKSRDGVWVPFHPTPGSEALPDAVRVHQEKSVALPGGKTDLEAGSTVTMTVVPGLAKFETQPVSDDDQTGAGSDSKIVQRTRLRAKCFIDLGARDFR